MQRNGIPVSAAYNDGKEYRSKKGKNNCEDDFVGVVPKSGSIILYNEVLKWHGRNMPKTYRGCAIVSSFETDDLLFVESAISPGYFITTSFPKTDFISGIIRYVQIKEVIYKKDATYNELDIFKLPDRLKKLVIS